MKKLTICTVGRLCLGIAITGIGVVHLIVPGFRPDILPVRPDALPLVVPFIAGILFSVAGFLIVFNLQAKLVSLVLGLLLLSLCILGHLPIILNGRPAMLAYWTPTVKLVALTGGLFVLANKQTEQQLPIVFEKISLITRLGQYMFAYQLIHFGVAHFVYVEGLAKIVPTWLGVPRTWVYAGGIGLIGSGIAIFIQFHLKLIMYLLCGMFTTWLIVLHIPSTVTLPFGDGSLTVSSLQCMACIGISLLISQPKQLEK